MVSFKSISAAQGMPPKYGPKTGITLVTPTVTATSIGYGILKTVKLSYVIISALECVLGLVMLFYPGFSLSAMGAWERTN